jgi:hypothetical protein
MAQAKMYYFAAKLALRTKDVSEFFTKGRRAGIHRDGSDHLVQLSTTTKNQKNRNYI